MRLINGVSLAPAVKDWLANTRQPRILHVFDRACDLINEHTEILSIVLPQIGNGPFNLVIDHEVLFSEYLNITTQISIHGNQLRLGPLLIHTEDAKHWKPRPDWERLHANRVYVANQLIKLPVMNTTPLFPAYLDSSLSLAVANTDISAAKTISSRLAGLGAGLTPAGDDFLMGAIYAAWIIHPVEVASVLTKEIAETAVPLTTSLSAAWLRSAGRGEAGGLWHEFFDALLSGDAATIQVQIDKLLSIGHTSGADALSGFLNVFTGWIENQPAMP